MTTIQDLLKSVADLKATTAPNGAMMSQLRRGAIASQGGGGGGGGGSILLGGYSFYQGAAAEWSFLNSIGLSAQSQGAIMDFLDGSTWATIGASFYNDFGGGGGINSYTPPFGTIVIGVPMLPGGSGPGSGAALLAALNSVTSGSEDTSINQAISEITSVYPNANTKLIIRMGWEFNGFWFPWCAGNYDSSAIQTAWKAAWVYWWTKFKAANSSIKFLWNPTLGNPSGDIACENYYPGNAYVDYIGLDVYNQSNTVPWPGDTAAQNTMLTGPYGIEWLEAYCATNGKAIAYPEWACTPTATSNPTSPGDSTTFASFMCTRMLYEKNTLGLTVLCMPWNNGSSAWNNFPTNYAVLEAAGL